MTMTDPAGVRERLRDHLYELLPAVYRERDAALGEPLRALLCEEFPGLDWPPLPPSITGNYMVGGLVRAADVPAVRTRLASHRYALKCDALDAQKLDEALGVAERLGTAFCEATEVYSGMEGELN